VPGGCSLCSLRSHQSSSRRDHSDPAADELVGECRQSIVLTLGPAIFNRDVTAFDIAAPLQAATKGRHQRRGRTSRCVVEKPDHRHGRRLRENSKRICRRCAANRNGSRRLIRVSIVQSRLLTIADSSLTRRACLRSGWKIAPPGRFDSSSRPTDMTMIPSSAIRAPGGVSRQEGSRDFMILLVMAGMSRSLHDPGAPDAAAARLGLPASGALSTFPRDYDVWRRSSTG
jgi:hypothetical protein